MSDYAQRSDRAVNLFSLPLQSVTAADEQDGDEDNTVSAAVSEPPDYQAMTVAELKALAKEKGLTGYSTLTKAELISLLEDNDTDE